MGKLTGKQRKIVGQNVISANVRYGKPKKVEVSCTSAKAGEQVKGAIAAAYPNFNFDKFDGNPALQVVGALITLGASAIVDAAASDWKFFYVECDSEDAAKNLVTDIGKCIEEYYVEPKTEEPEEKETASKKEDEKEPEEGKTDWTTYILLGLAAVAIVLLIWPKKKK